MTIKDYIKDNKEFDIEMECDLEFADPSSQKEAIENIEWVLHNDPTFQALSVVIRSYYGDTINW